MLKVELNWVHQNIELQSNCFGSFLKTIDFIFHFFWFIVGVISYSLECNQFWLYIKNILLKWAFLFLQENCCNRLMSVSPDSGRWAVATSFCQNSYGYWVVAAVMLLT